MPNIKSPTPVILSVVYYSLLGVFNIRGAGGLNMRGYHDFVEFKIFRNGGSRLEALLKK